MLLYVHSSIAIIWMGKRELIALLNLSSWCFVMVERLFLGMPRGCRRFVIVVFPDHTHLLFLYLRCFLLTVLLEFKTEQRYSQCEHGQPIEKTRRLFCTGDSVVAQCQSQHQVTSGELIRCSNRTARASELGSCQSNLCFS